MNDQFVSEIWPHALRVSQRTGLDPRLVVAQAALETGWGKSAPNNNYFGIKSHGRDGGSVQSTQEFENGQMVSRNANFRAYDGIGQSADDYAGFLESNPRYKPLLNARGFDNQVAALADSGYATDPNYGEKIKSIAARIDPNARPLSGPAAAEADNLGLSGFFGQQATRNQPMQDGLLGSFGANNEQQKPWYKTDKAVDVMGAISSAANSLQHNKDPNLDARLAQAKQGRMQKQQVNKTIQYLRANGRKDLIDAIEGGMDPKEALKIHHQEPKDDRTSMIKNVEALMAMGLTQEQALAQIKSGTSVEVNTGGEPGRYLYAEDAGLPKGWRFDTQTQKAEMIPGGPDALKSQDVDDKADRTKEQQNLKIGTTLESINLNISEIDNGGMPVTGPMGDLRRTWLGRAVTGSDATDFENRNSQISASAAFNELQNMRDNSPTGGAVGQLSDGERVALTASVTALNTAGSAEEYLRAAKSYRKLMLDLAYGEGMWKIDGKGSVTTTQNGPPRNKNLPIGTVKDGYIFMGGDPASPSSWSKQ